MRVLALVMFAAAPMLAVCQTTPHAARELQQQIKRSRAVVVNPAVIQRAGEVQRAAREPSASEPPVATPVPSEPESPAAESPATTEMSSPDAAVVSRVNSGELLYVPLDPPDETAARQLLTEQVAAVQPESATSLQSFDGAVRQLAEDNDEIELKSYVLVGQPLQYDPHERLFIGTVLIGVADLFGHGGPRSLTVPLQFEVLESALVDPYRVALRGTSPPYERIRVASRVVGQPVTLRIASNFSREGVSLQVPVEPTLIVDVDGDRLRAFGLQTTQLTVQAVGGAGTPRGTVTIRAPGGFLVDEEPAKFDEHGIARATLRTDSPGELVVSAVAAGYAPGRSPPVHVIWPWPTLVATSLGGLIGGFVRLAGRIRRGMKVGQFVVGLIVSILVGIIVFALYVVGVKVLPVTFSVELGDVFAFSAAALAGWLGVHVLPRLPAQSKAAT